MQLHSLFKEHSHRIHRLDLQANEHDSSLKSLPVAHKIHLVSIGHLVQGKVDATHHFMVTTLGVVPDLTNEGQIRIAVTKLRL